MQVFWYFHLRSMWKFLNQSPYVPNNRMTVHLKVLESSGKPTFQKWYLNINVIHKYMLGTYFLILLQVSRDLRLSDLLSAFLIIMFTFVTGISLMHFNKFSYLKGYQVFRDIYKPLFKLIVVL